MISNFSIKEEGFEVFNINKSKFYTNKQKIFNKILKKLPNNYQFLDYEYKIINSTLYTFHRDVTSSQKLLHPSYTVIIYFTETNNKLIEICPNSNKQTFIISDPITIYGRKHGGGRAVLFNADIVHAGAINETSERLAFQYKICHKDDINKLKHLSGQFIEKENKIRHFTLSDKIISFLSHKTILLFDTDLGKILEFKTNNFIINKISKLISIDFYNKS